MSACPSVAAIPSVASGPQHSQTGVSPNYREELRRRPCVQLVDRFISRYWSITPKSSRVQKNREISRWAEFHSQHRVWTDPLWGSLTAPLHPKAVVGTGNRAAPIMGARAPLCRRPRQEENSFPKFLPSRGSFLGLLRPRSKQPTSPRRETLGDTYCREKVQALSPSGPAKAAVARERSARSPSCRSEKKKYDRHSAGSTDAPSHIFVQSTSTSQLRYPSFLSNVRQGKADHRRYQYAY